MICCARNAPHRRREARSMIEMRRRQLSFGDGLIAEEVSDLREDWMEHADAVLADDEIVATVYEALAKRHPKSRCRGRRGAPADVVLRLLTLKHIRNWSYEEPERGGRANLVYGDFTHVGVLLRKPLLNRRRQKKSSLAIYRAEIAHQNCVRPGGPR